MNQSNAFAKETMRGFVGYFQLAWRSEAFAVRTKRDGEIRYFDTAGEAELAAWRIKHKIEDMKLVRGGETISSHQAAADALFPTLVRQKGSSRYTKVETVRRRA